MNEEQLPVVVSEINLIPNGTNVTQIETSIEAFNRPLAELLKFNGLPTENLLMPIEERRKVIFALESVLEIFPMEKREKAYYLSEFTVSIAVGQFNAALNFVWNETVKSLRRLVISFDLQYFFNVAETLSSRYKSLSNEDDLQEISEFDMLEICRRIGLLTDINHKKLEHINYLRNHASAAHPNENKISGYEMISILENCIKYAINAEPEHSVIQLKLLFANIRKQLIPVDDICIIGEDLKLQPQERIDDFLQSLFGLYCDVRQEQHTLNNIELLAPYLWELSTIDTQYRIGSKFGVFRKNGEVEKKDSCQRFLEIVDGLQFKDEDSLVAELIDKLQDLRSVHFSFNNFYNEYPYADSIADSLPASGIPVAARKLFVKIICICYIGNGLGYKRGVDERALKYYVEFIDKFKDNEIKEFIQLFSDSEFTSDMHTTKADSRTRELTAKLKTKTSDVHLKRALELIEQFPSSILHKISNDSKFSDAIKKI